ncbi:MAG: asparaginase [Firmicutes bacterium]|nr:asparaginase [Bacillota bacterium]
MNENEALKKVVILATGGTIAGQGAAGKTTGYKGGTLSIETIVDSAPGVEKLARIEAVQVCNTVSDSLTDKDWIHLANTINEMAPDPEIAGFVITHGTDTMDETAFFLNLVVKTEKPVVITGAMRPATATSADGPLNLYQAVLTAACPESVGKGVMVVFSDRIYGGRDVQKRSTYSVTALNQVEGGLLGVIRDEDIFYYYKSTRPHTVSSRFCVDGLEKLPKVGILYFHIDTDPALVSCMAELYEGLVIAGAGAGGTSRPVADEYKKLSIPRVIASRIACGPVTQHMASMSGSIAANNLPPQKAAVLLRLALTQTTDLEELKQIFAEY